ncbi:MAG: VWA domain-containing protein [Acidobacteria bacterium]|nr:VWA domain-containing protein [Acidobacteriota bacterium]
MKKLYALAVILTVASASLAGQVPAEPPAAPPVEAPTFRTGIDLIAVDVSVVDEDGRPVEDLFAPEFTVKIDGEERRVVSAEQVTFDVEAARREAEDPFESLYTTNLRPSNGRQIIIAVDQTGIRLGSMRPLLAAASRFLDLLSPADSVAFVAYPEPGVQVTFTSDRLRIKLAMDRAVGLRFQRRGAHNIGVYEAIAIAERSDGQMYDQVISRECPRDNGFTREQCIEDVAAESGEIAASVRQGTESSLRSLRNLLLALAVIEGPKTLVLMSESLVVRTPGELDDIIRAAALAQVTIHVLVMDVERSDISVREMGPTATQDREMQVAGLADLASGARGSLYYVVGSGDRVFERLAGEMRAHYVLGVEQEPGDRDGRAHRVDVEVRRRNVTVRSRRAFVFSSPTTNRQTAEETLLDALKSPFGVAEVPIRLATFTQKDSASDKARVVVAAEVGQPGGEPEEYTVGYVLLDGEGEVVGGTVNTVTLSVPESFPNAPREYLGEIVVDPGNYSLRFGVVDSAGRRGGVIRELSAWKLGGEEFALGDLMISDTSLNLERRIRPGVEPHVTGEIGAFLEMYSTSPNGFDGTTVDVEVADDQDSPALLTGAAEVVPGDEPTLRTVHALIEPMLLPAGRYVARARVMKDGKVAGVLVRPFILDPQGAAAAASSPFMRGAVAEFDSRVAMTSEILGSLLDSVETRFPGLDGPLAEARAGRFGTAAIEALLSGEQAAAAFFKGLDWYSLGQLGQAATQFEVASGPRREFFAAAFYLGAVYAAAGRDRDAAGVWQLALGDEPRPMMAYTLLADARLRDGQPGSVIDVLRPVHAREPEDDEINRRLASAYLMIGRYDEALPVLEGYLSRNPTDAVALFAAVFAHYQVATRERLVLPDEDVTRLARYVRAYEGPYEALLAKYLRSIRGG